MIENEKEKAIRIHQFVLNNNSDNIRESLYEYMILRAIYEHGESNNVLDKEAILQNMEKDYGVVGFHPSIIDNTLKRLEIKKNIIVDNNKIKLSVKKQEEVKNNNLVFIASVEKIKQDIEKKIELEIGISKERSEDITKEFFR